MRQRRRHHDEEHIDESWLIPYADILTLLLALFIILFAASKIDQKKYEMIVRGFDTAFKGTPYTNGNLTSSIDDSSLAATKLSKTEDDQIEAKIKEKMNKETNEMTDMKNALDKYIGANGLNSQIDTQLNSDMLMITIRDNALFESGKATVKTESQQLAVLISKILCDYPSYNVEVAGYTDNVPMTGGEFTSNWSLSTQRAVNFMEYLMSSKAINESRFKAVGYGEYKPINANDTEEDRSKNRRVEIHILRSVRATNLVPAMIK